MSELITNRIRRHRETAGWTQSELAEAADISRQALSAIESGKSVPSTAVGLRLARALGQPFDELFALSDHGACEVARVGSPVHGRVAMGRVNGRWVAHAVQSETAISADGLVESAVGNEARVDLLRPGKAIEHNLLVAGCAPALGMLAERFADRSGLGRVRWLPQPSMRSLDLLRDDLVHIAGLHLFDEATGEYNTPWIRRALPDRDLRVVTLARWRQGLVVAPGNPRDVDRVVHLLRPGVRVVRRPEGAGAQQLLDRHLRDDGIDPAKVDYVAEAPDHAAVARLVSLGLADSGPCIESTALEFGLGFVPLAEERFDLVIPTSVELPGVRVLLDELESAGFHRELGAFGGYDTRETGALVEGPS